MSLKKSLYISITLFCGILLMGFVLANDKDALHKRIFNITIFETKDGQPSKKSETDKIEFKNGKLYSYYLYEKFQYKWIKYRINKDSTYTDSTATQVRLLEVEASVTDDKNQTVIINFSTVEWDIEGTIKITKNDLLKKQMDFVGREKGGKPKKEKKKKNEPTKEDTTIKKE